MRSAIAAVLVLCSGASFSQVAINGPWSLEVGASAIAGFSQYPSLNIRYISPRFKWSEDWSPEEEKNPEPFRNMRIMLELIYSPPLNVLGTGINAQYRMIRYNRFSFEIYGGLKLFLITPPDFKITNRRNRRSNEAWYMNIGLISQFDLGVISPFIDVGGDMILTLGSEFKFHAIHKKTKRRYKLKAKQVD